MGYINMMTKGMHESTSEVRDRFNRFPDLSGVVLTNVLSCTHG